MESPTHQNQALYPSLKEILVFAQEIWTQFLIPGLCKGLFTTPKSQSIPKMDSAPAELSNICAQFYTSIFPPPVLIAPALWKSKFASSLLQEKFPRRNTAHCRKNDIPIHISGKISSAWGVGAQRDHFFRWDIKKQYIWSFVKSMACQGLYPWGPQGSQAPWLFALPSLQLQL